MKNVYKLLLVGVFAIVSMMPAAAAERIKVGFIYIGPIGDHGWTYQHDQGRLALEEALGNQVETVYVEKVAEGPDSARTMTRLAQADADIIFTTSFGYMDPTLQVAKRFNDIKFEHATGFKRSDNVSTYSARFYEGRYIIGQIAGLTSKKGVAGYIASFPIPEVIRGINAFLLGAQSVNPDFKLKIVWISSWFDPGKEADAAKVLISQGADVLTQHTDSTAPLQIAQDHGVFGFGQASDMHAFAPDAQMTAITNNWGPYYIERVQAVLDGTWQSSDSWDGLDAGMVKMAPYQNMPNDVADMARATEKAIADGTLKPFAGPIYKQDGSLVVDEGEELDDGALLGMNWYVQGIDGEVPK